MTEITRNRTIRPSTRLEKSKSYKIDTKTVSRGDTLVVNIDHETKSFSETCKFNGANLAQNDSISFRVNEYGNSRINNWIIKLNNMTQKLYLNIQIGFIDATEVHL